MPTLHIQGVFDELVDTYESTEAELIREVFAFEKKLEDLRKSERTESGEGIKCGSDNDKNNNGNDNNDEFQMERNKPVDDGRSVYHSIFGTDDLDNVITNGNDNDNINDQDNPALSQDTESLPSPRIDETQRTEAFDESTDSEDIIPATQPETEEEGDGDVGKVVARGISKRNGGQKEEEEEEEEEDAERRRNREKSKMMIMD